MKAFRKAKLRPAARGVYERLSQRLEELAEREGRYSNAEKIRLIRRASFASVDALAASGKVVIPK